ncbi:MAG: hypothetical protein FWF51_09100 [Chitinivibrionia bacterium]|nr:hypothetical protein [Chitinivibrionia bacterium]
MTLQECAKEAEQMRDLYVEAQKTLLRGGKSYTIGGQSFTRENLSEILKALQYWE